MRLTVQDHWHWLMAILAGLIVLLLCTSVAGLLIE